MYFPIPFKRITRRLSISSSPSPSAVSTPTTTTSQARETPRKSPHMWGPTRLPFSALAQKKSSAPPSASKSQTTTTKNGKPIAVGVSYPNPPSNPVEEGISKRDVMTLAGVEYLIKKLEPIERWQAAHAGALAEDVEGEKATREKARQVSVPVPVHEMEALQSAFGASNLGGLAPSYEIG